MSAVPVLMGVCLVGAVLVGLMTVPVSRIISRIVVLNEKEGVNENVRKS